MTAKGEILGSIVVRAMGRNRRVSPVAARLSEGRFTQATAATQAWRPEPLFMPHLGHSPIAAGLWQ